MSLTHAILGILNRHPMTGYDLKTQQFDYTIAHFWPADQAQIYRTLDKMAEQGWIHSQTEIQEDRPNRKVYSTNAGGKRELEQWLITPQALAAYREPFLIQLFFAQGLSNKQIINLLEEQRQSRRTRLDHYLQIPLPSLDQLTDDREFTLQRLTLEQGIRVEQAHLDWLDMAINAVRNLPQAEG